MMSIIDAFSASFGLAGIKTCMPEQARKHHSIGPIALCYLITIHSPADNIQNIFLSHFKAAINHRHPQYRDTVQNTFLGAFNATM